MRLRRNYTKPLVLFTQPVAWTLIVRGRVRPRHFILTCAPTASIDRRSESGAARGLKAGCSRSLSTGYNWDHRAAVSGARDLRPTPLMTAPADALRCAFGGVCPLFPLCRPHPINPSIALPTVSKHNITVTAIVVSLLFINRLINSDMTVKVVLTLAELGMFYFPLIYVCGTCPRADCFP
jgi:hypothetical protein